MNPNGLKALESGQPNWTDLYALRNITPGATEKDYCAYIIMYDRIDGNEGDETIYTGKTQYRELGRNPQA